MKFNRKQHLKWVPHPHDPQNQIWVRIDKNWGLNIHPVYEHGSSIKIYQIYVMEIYSNVGGVYAHYHFLNMPGMNEGRCKLKTAKDG